MKYTRSLFLILVVFALPRLALAAGTPPSYDMKAKNQAVFCKGVYALCIRAVCAPIPSQDQHGNFMTDYAACSCVVENGWSMGPGNCDDRKPVTKNGLTFIMSTYSNRFNTQNKTLSCNSESTKWAWCYGAPCVVNPRDPKSATCNCPMQTGPMKTLGGKCSQKSCNLIWSAATPAADTFANKHFVQAFPQDAKYKPHSAAPACFRGVNR